MLHSHFYFSPCHTIREELSTVLSIIQHTMHHSRQSICSALHCNWMGCYANVVGNIQCMCIDVRRTCNNEHGKMWTNNNNKSIRRLNEREQKASAHRNRGACVLKRRCDGFAVGAVVCVRFAFSMVSVIVVFAKRNAIVLCRSARWLSLRILFVWDYACECVRHQHQSTPQT